MVACGDYPTKETMAAIDIIKTHCPNARIRCVNVSSLTTVGFGTLRRVADQKFFDKVFTDDKPVIFNFGLDSPAVAGRVAELGIRHYYPGQHRKAPFLRQISENSGIPLQHAAYIGDDWVDASAEIGRASCRERV